MRGVLVLAFGLWVRERTATRSRPWAALGLAASVVGLVGALWLAFLTKPPAIPGAGSPVGEAEAGPLPYEPYPAERLAAARSAGRPVLVNMTAAWCITCLVNERVALSAEAVADAFQSADVLYLKGDWTNRDGLISAYLEGFGRSGVPLYVLYPPRGEPLVLPQILTESRVLEALGSLRSDSRGRSG